MSADSWVIIPAHNEAQNIGKVLDKVKKYTSKIVVVDDGSSDSTMDVALSRKVHVLRHIINLGKGATLKTGCDFALSKGAKSIIVLDADGQHDPKEIPSFQKKLSRADIVLGYRKMNDNMPWIFRFGNSFINWTTKLLFGINVKDTQCGFRAFTSLAYKRIRWNSTDYSMESEMIARIGKSKLKYLESPIETIYADTYKGTTVLDGIKIVFNMLIWRLRE